MELSAIFWTAGIIVSLLIGYEDFKSRHIHIISFVIFGLLGILYRYHEQANVLWKELGINHVGILFIVAGIKLFASFKKAGPVMDRQLGWGDIVMWSCLACWLSPLEFVYFFTICTGLLACIYSLMQGLGWVSAKYPIPLAGWMGGIFSVYQVMMQFI